MADSDNTGEKQASASTRRSEEVRERVRKRDAKKSNDNSGEASSSSVAANAGIIKGDTAEASKRKVPRPDMKATSEMIENKMVLYPEKRIGTLPGIDVSMEFRCRAEMVALCIHHHHQSGIDFITEDSPEAKREDMKSYKFPLAVSIVLSGQYEDDQDNCEEIVYTGQGGNDLSRKKTQIADQELKGGNLALQVYFAHGRIPKSVAEIKGLVCKDISKGRENLPIPVTNVVDAPPVEPQGTYVRLPLYT